MVFDFMVFGQIEEIVSLPEGINIEINGTEVKLKSGSSECSRKFKVLNIKFSKEGNAVKLVGIPLTRKTRALIKTIAAHLKNMAKGVKEGHEYRLAIVYSHFPLNVQVKGSRIEINNFLGEKKPRIAQVYGKVKVEVKGKEMILTGTNLEEVSQTSANIEQATRIKNKDRRIFQDGIFLTSKEKI